eukprot:COSAG06_NODE_18260_length_895_cov_12.933417_1_plen_85_part_10
MMSHAAAAAATLFVLLSRFSRALPVCGCPGRPLTCEQEEEEVTERERQKALSPLVLSAAFPHVCPEPVLVRNTHHLSLCVVLTSS